MAKFFSVFFIEVFSLFSLHKQRERKETFADISKTFIEGDYETTLPDGVPSTDKRFTQVLPPAPTTSPPPLPSYIPPPPQIPPPPPPVQPSIPQPYKKKMPPPTSAIPRPPSPPPIPEPAISSVPPGTSLYIPPPPPPPPPPPIQDPMEVRLRKVKRDHSTKIPREERKLSHSVDEIKSKALSMKQIRENTTEVDGSPMKPEDIIDKQIKKASELRSVPKEDRLKLAYQSELQGAVLKRAQRTSQSWENEELKLELRKAEKSQSAQMASELEARAQRVRKSWAVPEEKERSFSAQIYHQGSTELPGGISEELPTTEHGLDAFVDNLFEPVLSSDVDYLGNEYDLSRSIKGGGKMHRSSVGSPQSSNAPPTGAAVPSAFVNGGLPSGVNRPT